MIDDIFKNNFFAGALVFLGALLVGALYIGPPLFVKKHFEKSDNVFVLAQYKTYRDSLQAYLPRAREIYDGHFPPSELYGSPGAPTIQNLIPSTLFSVFIFLFKGNIDLAYLGAQFVFSGIIFTLFYVLGQIIFRSRVWSWFFSLTAVLSPIVLKLPFYKWQGFSEFQAFFINNFLPFVRTQFDQLYLARVDEPLLTYPFYLAAIISFFIFWTRPTLKFALFSGFFAGLMFYTYFHHWVYWLVVLLVLFLYALVARDRNRIKSYLVLFSALAVTTIPYFWMYNNFRSLDTYQDFILRAGVVFGHSLGVARDNIADYFVYLLLVLVVYFVYRHHDRNKFVLFLGLIGGMMLVWNIQMVVGYLPVPHFFRRSISPIIFIIVFAVLHDLSSRVTLKRLRLKKVFLTGLVVLSLFIVAKKIINIVLINYSLQEHIVDYYKFPSEVAVSWKWVNHNLSPESVIVSPSTLTSFYLNTHTFSRPFLPTAFITLLSVKEMEDRYLLSHKLFGVRPEVLEQRLAGKLDPQCEAYDCFPDKDSNLNDSFGNLYGGYFSSRYNTFNSIYSSNSDQDFVTKKRQEKIIELSGRYKTMRRDWSEIGTGYVYVGPLEEQITGNNNFITDRGLKIVYKDPQVSMYKILKQ
ncbi:MAG: hypothetical protein Q8Q95_01710 [bacterium]|nr:hypothetical protein [bacterium]